MYGQDRRGNTENQTYLDNSRVFHKVIFPLNEILIDFFDALKSVTRGYARFDQITSMCSSLIVYIYGHVCMYISMIVLVSFKMINCYLALCFMVHWHRNSLSLLNFLFFPMIIVLLAVFLGTGLLQIWPKLFSSWGLFKFLMKLIKLG